MKADPTDDEMDVDAEVDGMVYPPTFNIQTEVETFTASISSQTVRAAKLTEAALPYGR